MKEAEKALMARCARSGKYVTAVCQHGIVGAVGGLLLALFVMSIGFAAGMLFIGGV